MSGDARGNALFVQGAMKPLGHATYTLITTNQVLTLNNTPNNGNTLAQVTASAIANGLMPRIMLMDATANNVRFLDDGSTPSPTVGIGIHVGTLAEYYNGDLTTFQFTAEANNANLTVIYYG